MYPEQGVRFVDAQVGYGIIDPPQRPTSGGARKLPDLVMIKVGLAGTPINILAAIGKFKSP